MGLLDAFRSKPTEAVTELADKEEESNDSAGPSLSEDLPSTRSRAALTGALPDGDGELYNPYKGLQTALDARGAGEKIGFKVSQRPEFVFVEDSSVRRRGWSENLTYYTGAGYLAGAALGGGLGAVQALQAPPPQLEIAGNTARLRLNRFLNSSGKTGRLYGNTLGVVGLYFACSESVLFNYAEPYHLPDALSTLSAGFMTGALYRLPRGPRPAAVAGAVGTAGAGLLLAGRAFIAGGL